MCTMPTSDVESLIPQNFSFCMQLNPNKIFSIIDLKHLKTTLVSKKQFCYWHFN